MQDTLIRGRLPARIHAEWVEVDYLQEMGESGLLVEVWPRLRDYTMVDIFRARSIVDHVKRAVTLPGDLIECGTWRGGIGLLIGLVIRELGVAKKVYLCDTFEGLPPPDPTIDRQYQPGEFRADDRELQAIIDELGLTNICELRKGLFADTLRALPAHQTLCFAHIDCDLYRSTLDCLAHLFPRLVPGAPIVFDDYYDGSGGVALAVNELATRTGHVVHLGPPPQAFVIKGMTASARTTVMRSEDHAVAISTERLQADTLFQAFLAELAAFYADALGSFDRFTALCRSGLDPADAAMSLRGGEVRAQPASRRWKRFLFKPGRPPLA